MGCLVGITGSSQERGRFAESLNMSLQQSELLKLDELLNEDDYLCSEKPSGDKKPRAKQMIDLIENTVLQVYERGNIAIIDGSLLHKLNIWHLCDEKIGVVGRDNSEPIETFDGKADRIIHAIDHDTLIRESNRIARIVTMSHPHEDAKKESKEEQEPSKCTRPATSRLVFS